MATPVWAAFAADAAVDASTEVIVLLLLLGGLQIEALEWRPILIRLRIREFDQPS